MNSWLLYQTDANPNLADRKQTKYYHDLISKVSSHLCSSKLVHSDLLNKGTQLKLLLTLEEKIRPQSVAKMKNQYIDAKSPYFDHKYANLRDQVRAVFKPKWYENSRSFPNVVDGKDRHYGELVGFLLSVLLEMYRAPLTVLTQFKMADIVASASDRLNETYFLGPGNSSCFQVGISSVRFTEISQV